MKNLTVSLPEATLDRLRVIAAKRKQSVNRFVGQVLQEVVSGATADWETTHAALFDKIQGLRSDRPWTREEIHEGRGP